MTVNLDEMPMMKVFPIVDYPTKRTIGSQKQGLYVDVNATTAERLSFSIADWTVSFMSLPCNYSVNVPKGENYLQVIVGQLDTQQEPLNPKSKGSLLFRDTVITSS